MQFEYDSKTLSGACILEEVTLGDFINWIWWWWSHWLRVLVLCSFCRGRADQRAAVRGKLNRMHVLGLRSHVLNKYPAYLCSWRLYYKICFQEDINRDELIRDWIRKYSLLLSQCYLYIFLFFIRVVYLSTYPPLETFLILFPAISRLESVWGPINV